MIDKISKSITKTDERIELKQGLSFVDYQTNMVKLAKNITKTVQDMVGKAATDVDSLRLLASQLTRDFDLLASNSRGAAVSVQNMEVLSAATVVAKHTSALCNVCRLASSKTDNPMAKRHFVQSAKDLANSTAHVVKAIKALGMLGSNFTEENNQKCAEAAKPLV